MLGHVVNTLVLVNVASGSLQALWRTFLQTSEHQLDSSSSLPEPGPRLSESSAAGMNRVSQRCTCSGLFFCSDFCKPAFMTVCLLWAWLSTRRQSHDKQLYGWDLLTVQTAYSWFLFFINNWNIDSMKDEWSRRYKCDAQTATPHSNQITRWWLVITFPPHTLISCQSWQETLHTVDLTLDSPTQIQFSNWLWVQTLAGTEKWLWSEN